VDFLICLIGPRLLSHGCYNIPMNQLHGSIGYMRLSKDLLAWLNSLLIHAYIP
jgi:hypothetical protein